MCETSVTCVCTRVILYVDMMCAHMSACLSMCVYTCDSTHVGAQNPRIPWVHTGACPVQTAQRVGPRLLLDTNPQASHTHRRGGVRPGGLLGGSRFQKTASQQRHGLGGLRMVLARGSPTEQPTPQLL